nr:hypothetical protein [Nanoarchaeum sp.]
MKYLIVEDNFGDVSLLKLMLSNVGFSVDVVHPEEALQINKETQPEIIQLDGLAGRCFELYQQMRQDNLNARYLLFSANRELYDQAREVGMDVFDKSWGGSDLIQYAKQLIKNK